MKRLSVIACLTVALLGPFELGVHFASANETSESKPNKQGTQSTGCGYPTTVRDGLNGVQYFYLAELYLRQFRLQRATDCIQKLRRCEPHDEAERRANVLERTLLPRESVPAGGLALLQKAQTVYADTDQSSKILKTCIATYPRFEWPYILLAHLEITQKHTADAKDLFAKVLAINPLNVMGLSGLANISLDEQKITEACNYLRQVRNCNPYYRGGNMAFLEMRCKIQDAKQTEKNSSSTTIKEGPSKPPAERIRTPSKEASQRAKTLSSVRGMLAEKKQPEREYGFIDKMGQPVFDVGPNVLVEEKFANGFLRVNVLNDNGNGGNRTTQYWNRNGSLAFDVVFEAGKSFSDDMCAIQKRLWGFADHEGRVVIATKFTDVLPFSEQLAAVCFGSGWGFIDRAGVLAIEPIYDQCLPFSEGLAAIELDGKVGFIDKNGLLVIPPTYDLARSFSNGLAEVATFEGESMTHHKRYIDRDGKVRFDLSDLENQYGGGTREAGPYNFTDGGTMIAKYGALCRGVSDEEKDFHENMLAVRLGGKYGYLDPNGKVLIQPEFERAFRFSGGLAMVQQNGKIGYINNKGHFIIPPQYAQATSFSEGLAAVSATGECWGYIDGSGKMVIPEKFLAAQPFCEGLANVATER